MDHLIGKDLEDMLLPRPRILGIQQQGITMIGIQQQGDTTTGMKPPNHQHTRQHYHQPQISLVTECRNPAAFATVSTTK